MPSRSDVSSLLSLNLRPSAPASSSSLGPTRQADANAPESSFRDWLSSPQARAAKDSAQTQRQAQASNQTPNQAQSRPEPAETKTASKPLDSTESEPKGWRLSESSSDGVQSLGLAETAEALTLPLEVELTDSAALEEGLQELLQWLEEEGLEVLDTEQGQEQLHALLAQMGLAPAPDQMPGLAAQIRAALTAPTESGTSQQDPVARLKALLSPPPGNNGAVQINAQTPEGMELESSKSRGLGELADFGSMMKVANKAEINRGGAEATLVRGEAPVIHSVMGAEASARDTQLQPSDRQFVVQPEVRVPVGQPQWGRAVGERILWLANQNISSAELRLDPPDLGPVQVRVVIHNDQVNVTFTSNQAAVREALDLSAQRLRDMFSEQGLDLVDVNVSDQSEGGAFGEQQREGRGGHGQGEEDVADVQPQRLSLHLVDSYV